MTTTTGVQDPVDKHQTPRDISQTSGEVQLLQSLYLLKPFEHFLLPTPIENLLHTALATAVSSAPTPQRTPVTAKEGLGTNNHPNPPTPPAGQSSEGLEC